MVVLFLEASRILKYRIIRVYEGRSYSGTIKVAHYGGSSDRLQVGDVRLVEIELNDRLRRAAETAFEDFGVIIPEGSLADFVFVRTLKGCRYIAASVR